MATGLQSENLVHIVNGNCEGSDTLRRGLSEIKHFPVVGSEAVSPSQECVLVLYFTWKRVGAAKVCAWILVAVGIISNVDVPVTKSWTITWVPANCSWWPCHQALEWSKAFFVAKWKYECIGSGTIATTGLYRTIKIKTKILIPNTNIAFEFLFNGNERRWKQENNNSKQTFKFLNFWIFFIF